MDTGLNTHVWACLEIKLEAEKTYENPFREVELVGQFDGPNGERLLVPGFWDGDNCWKLRFAPPAVGTWRWTSLPSDLSDGGLRRQGTLLASPWSASDLEANPNRRGFLKVHPSGRFFTYADGTPFYWLGDTLWAAHTARCDPEEALPRYLADRRDKGFSVIQLVAGHPTAYPGGEDASGYNVVGDAPELYTNEGGFPYTRPFDLINPAYFGALDRRLELMLASGFVPCLMGMWGQELEVMGVAAYKAYWRYLIARYAAYNVLWSVAGEYFFTPDEAAWREVGREIHRLDPYGHPTSAHSTAPHSGSRHFQEDEWYDFNLIQVGHVLAFKTFVEALPLVDYHARPTKPTIMSESWYEHHPNRLVDDGQWIGDRDIRFATYVPLLQGCIGQTYGAHGIWPFYDGAGGGWSEDERPGYWWEDLNLPGSAQMKHLRTLMDELKWWGLEPHPEWVSTPVVMNAYCAAIHREQYVVYSSGDSGHLLVFITGGDGEGYEGRWFNPRTGAWSKAASDGYSPYGNGWLWRTRTPDEADWVLVLERVVGAASL